ncbi:hypothetical protein C3942_04360 [Solimonas fluminis]|jgi:hypothetical protein|uniref:Uncharacterized protein n=1 Tax=Solimonas fluminis TaxID=2086571 RepID=A0A2S5TIU8_9GAMM|nr:hypothetical protein [Solimonas fluminis]PPE74916.1 hypothetical protein C3942_04360 [Solimonas fluminis]
MDTQYLQLPEWHCLLRAARGASVSDAGLAVLARLERLGLLMRAGSGRHLVTSRGLQLLERSAPSARAA